MIYDHRRDIKKGNFSYCDGGDIQINSRCTYMKAIVKSVQH